MWLVAVTLATVVLAACAGDGDDSQAPIRTALTDAERAWCAENPFEHEAAANALGIRVVGDFLRASAPADDSELADLEPPLLAIPSSASEPLKYQLQFDDPIDGERACRAALGQRVER